MRCRRRKRFGRFLLFFPRRPRLLRARRVLNPAAPVGWFVDARSRNTEAALPAPFARWVERRESPRRPFETVPDFARHAPLAVSEKVRTWRTSRFGRHSSIGARLQAKKASSLTAPPRASVRKNAEYFGAVLLRCGICGGSVGGVC